jgi:hypothetical protein
MRILIPNDNRLKHEIFENVLLSDVLYRVELFSKKKKVKTYILRGDSTQIGKRSRQHFLWQVYNERDELQSSTDKIPIGGSFFEHMALFQIPEGKAVVGQGVQIWGYMVMIHPYATTKEQLKRLIEQDLN